MKLKDCIIIILAVVIAIVVGVFVGFKFSGNKDGNNQNVNNNHTNNNQEENNEQNNHQVLDLKNLSHDGYGYILLENNGKQELLELRKNSESKVVATCEANCGFSNLSIKNGKFVFDYTNQKNYKVFIDLKELSYKVITGFKTMTSSDSDDLYDEYLYLDQRSGVYGIEKYNIKTGTSVMIAESMEISEFVIFDSMIYAMIYALEDTNMNDGNSAYDFFKIDLNGEVLDEITYTEYEEVKKRTGYASGYHGIDKYFVYNNKRISLSDDFNQLLIDGVPVYTAPTGKEIELFYSNVYGEINFWEYRYVSQSVEEQKWYTYNIDNQKLTLADESDFPLNNNKMVMVQ